LKDHLLAVQLDVVHKLGRVVPVDTEAFCEISNGVVAALGELPAWSLAEDAKVS